MSFDELWKYDKAYADEKLDYGLPSHSARYKEVRADIASIPLECNYLDVGCGRGESITMATSRGIRATGVDFVEALCDGGRIIRADIEALPFADAEFDYVSCYDVLEHLVPGTEQAALNELGRVCKYWLILTTNKKPSQLPSGEDLHVNKREWQDWDDDIRKRWPADVHSSTYGHEEWKWVIRIASGE